MARIDLRIQGVELHHLRLRRRIPLQLMSLPTTGLLPSGVSFHVTKGHPASSRSTGCPSAGLCLAQGHPRGRRRAPPIVDVRADDAQRDTILKIMSGEDAEPGTTIFNVFAEEPTPTVYTPMFKPIIVEVDFDKRTGRFDVEGVVQARIETIASRCRPPTSRGCTSEWIEYEEGKSGAAVCAR